MTIQKPVLSKGFVLAGLMNMSVLVFSLFFTNPAIPNADPDVMSNFGLLMIVTWGLAYIAVAKNYENVKWLVAVFAFEKLCYAINWTVWIRNNTVGELTEKDTVAGIFYTILWAQRLAILLFLFVCFCTDYSGAVIFIFFIEWPLPKRYYSFFYLPDRQAG